MNPGDILLFKGEDGISKLIQWGTGSKYSHVAICVSPEMNLAIEANTRGGVRAIDIRNIKEPYDIYRVKESYNLTKTISYLVSKLNSNYDYLGVLFLGLLKVLAKLKLPVKKIANNWQKERDYFCSELCYEAFYHGGGLDIAPAVSQADTTSPGDISKSEVTEMVGTHESQRKGKKINLSLLFKIILVLFVLHLYGWPLYKIYKIPDYLVPVNVKNIIEDKNIMLYNLNIDKNFFKDYLSIHIKEFRVPLIKDLIQRIRYRTFGKTRPIILIHQSFYSYIYYTNGPNYSAVPIITIKNIGGKAGIINTINVDIDSRTKHDYKDPDFKNVLPVTLFPNEEILLCYGQEIPPDWFTSTVDVNYVDLKGNSYVRPTSDKKKFLYSFDKKIYQFYF